jgi:hypothetical protein
MRKPTDPEVIETMQHDARNEPQRVLYALLAGAEGCGPAARSARGVAQPGPDSQTTTPAFPFAGR